MFVWHCPIHFQVMVRVRVRVRVRVVVRINLALEIAVPARTIKLGRGTSLHTLAFHRRTCVVDDGIHTGLSTMTSTSAQQADFSSDTSLFTLASVHHGECGVRARMSSFAGCDGAFQIGLKLELGLWSQEEVELLCCQPISRRVTLSP